MASKLIKIIMVKKMYFLTTHSIISILSTKLYQNKTHVLALSAGLLSLEEFRLLSNDAFQRFLMQRGVKRSQLVRNSRHTWLYQGKGAHQVLQDIKERWATF